MDQDALRAPLELVDRMFAHAAEAASRAGAGPEALASKEAWDAAAAVEAMVADPAALAAVPSLNAVDADALAPGSLVRYRCMVRETLDPEYYAGVFAERETATGRVRLRTGKFRDAVAPAPGCVLEDVPGASPAAFAFMRVPAFCVSVPGECEWVRRADVAQPAAGPGPVARAKRGRGAPEEQTDTDMGDAPATRDEQQQQQQQPPQQQQQQEQQQQQKRPKAEAEPEASAGESALDELLRPGGAGEVQAIVKMYDAHASGLKIGDVLECVGVLVKDPDLYGAGGGSNGDSSGDPFFSAAEREAQNPPASLVHRLHCMALRRVPSVGHTVAPAAGTPAFAEAARALAPLVPAARESLVVHLSAVLGGDAAAAELVLLHLLSRMPDGVRHGAPVGKLTLNLFGCTAEAADRLEDFLRLVLPKHRRVPCTVAELNRRRMVPCKDADTNRLIPGRLQVALGTHVLLDETALSEGQLTETGTRNVRALDRLLAQQRLEYDFPFQGPLEFPVDSPVLVVSNTRSILGCDARVELRPRHAAGQALPPLPSDGSLDVWRAYLAVARQSSIEVGADMEPCLQAELKELRARGLRADQDALHLRLNIARLVGASALDARVEARHWERMKALVDRVQA